MLQLLRLLLITFLPLWTVCIGLSVGLGMLRTGDVLVAAVMSSQRGDYRIETIDVETGFRSVYQPDQLLAGVLFSPDGRYALMAALQPYQPVMVRDMQTGALYQTPMDLQVSGASWLADKVLLTGYDPTQFYFGVYTIDMGTAETHHVLDVQDEVWTEWLPAGERFAFSRQDRLYTVRSDGRESQQMVMGENPVASPDGRYLAFSRDGGLHLVSLDDATEARSLSPGSFNPVWSPDGGRVAYSVIEGSERVTHITEVMTGETVRVPIPGTQLVDDLRWSPDGARLAVVMGDRDRQELYVISADGRNPRLIADDGYDPVWSPDGTRLLFRTQERNRLYMIGLRDEAEQHLIAANAEDQTWSPDGKQVAFRQPIVPGSPADLQIVTLDSGQSWRVFGMGNSVQSFVYKP